MRQASVVENRKARTGSRRACRAISDSVSELKTVRGVVHAPTTSSRPYLTNIRETRLAPRQTKAATISHERNLCCQLRDDSQSPRASAPAFRRSRLSESALKLVQVS